MLTIGNGDAATSGRSVATRAAIFIACLSCPAVASADERAVFYGTWGSAAQCARAPIKPGGAVMAAPFEISADWLRHGRIWCRLNWFPVEPREGGAFSGAHAQCGEDAVRAYFLGMVLSGDELTLRWEFPLSNGPLKRCPAG